MIRNSFSIIHLSDLHFGRIHPDTLDHLEEFLRLRRREIKIAIITGDLTQRAKTKEFEAAIEFMTSLNAPLFVVPGNHDVPLYNLFLRFFSPYKKFLSYVGPYAQNYYEDQDVALYGLWTVNQFAIEDGILREKDLKEVEEKFRRVPEGKIKILAAHHPLLEMEQVERLMGLRPHLLLWGHEHQGLIHSVNKESLYPLVIAAGTTTSSRVRNEANSFNYLTFSSDTLKVEVFRHSKLLNTFEPVDVKEFFLRENKKREGTRPSL